MGCGASTVNVKSYDQESINERPFGSVTSSEDEHTRASKPVTDTTTDKDETAQASEVVVAQTTSDSPKFDSSYAESGPCAEEERADYNSTPIEKMDVRKRFPDIVRAVSTYKLSQGIRTSEHWKSLEYLNEVHLHHTCSEEEKDAVGEYCISQGLHERMVRDLKEFQILCRSSSGDIFSDDLWNNIFYLLLAAINYTDGLRPFCKGLVDEGILSVLIFFMEEVNLRGLAEDSRPGYLVKMSVEMNVNLIKGASPQAMNEYGIVDALLPFAKGRNQTLAVAALVALAAIVDEEQNDLLMASPEPIKMILELLESALRYDDHRLVGGTQWSAYELGDGLSQIAVNDKNKVEIVKQGGLRVVNKFLMKAQDAVEEASAAKCFWMLAFNEDNVKKIKKFPDSIKKLRELKSSPDSQVSTSASGALWEIEQKAKREKDVKGSRSNLKKTDTGDDNMPHIMISYQWDVQSTLIKVKDRLQQSGYKVWMDIEQMQGSTLEAMAKAVENSALVLVCISSKYKESPNCRSEAEYAFQLKKDIIPLMVEKNFKPSGWLGMIVGSKLWYDFAESIRVQETVDKLLKELNSRVPQAIVGAKPSQPITVTDGPSLSAEPPKPSTTNAVSAVSKWTDKDVVSWVKKIGLSKKVKLDAFNQFNGDLLNELWKLKQECPAVYYSALEKDLALAGLMDILRFNQALSSCMTN